MNTWIIEPRDPLIVRDGRPFGPTPGARAASLSFPFPSTTTGGVRTRDGLGPDGRFQQDKENLDRVKNIAVSGPVLVELDATTGEIAQWLVPAPADALLLELETPDTTTAVRQALTPLELPTGASTNLPAEMKPVGMAHHDPHKPHKKAPRFWFWEEFQQWLENPQETQVTLKELGHDGSTSETRTHVSIEPDSQTNADGALFQTRGLEFTEKEKRTRLALALNTDAPNLKPGLAPLGGERRLVNWRHSDKGFPSCPPIVRERNIQQRHCRVLLLTPACFTEGSHPSWLLTTREGVTPSLIAMAVVRPQVVSGWDFEKDRPKPTRRLAPAGTVLFLNLNGTGDAISRWVDATWMHCVSDKEEDRRDGFGLAVLGVWDGKAQGMEV